jgi:hypothetical protein
MSVFSSNSTQLNLTQRYHCIVTVTLHYDAYISIIIHMIVAYFCWVEERNQWFTSLCSSAKCCACNLETIVAILYCQKVTLQEVWTILFDKKMVPRNAVVFNGQSQQRNPSGCSCINRSRDKSIYFLLSVQQCLGPKCPGILYPWLIRVSMLSAIRTFLRKSWCLSITYMITSPSRHVVTKFQETFRIKEFYRKLLPFFYSFSGLCVLKIACMSVPLFCRC